ncbi:MAG: hypothetical protein U0Q18_14900 [Bryobacteraceae bacterium]
MTNEANYRTKHHPDSVSEPVGSQVPIRTKAQQISGDGSVAGMAPRSSRDLRPSERRFLLAMQQLGYGRFEDVPIRRGELVLDPWPATIKMVKFGPVTCNLPVNASSEFDLKSEVIEFFDHVRSIDRAEIKHLQIRGGLPFYMELAERRTKAI